MGKIELLRGTCLLGNYIVYLPCRHPPQCFSRSLCHTDLGEDKGANSGPTHRSKSAIYLEI